MFRTGVRGFHVRASVSATFSSLAQRGTAMPSPPSTRVHAEHTCKICSSRPSVWNLILQSIHAAASVCYRASSLDTSFLFQGFPHSDSPDWPVFLNNTETLRGWHCQFVSHTHWVSNYYTFVCGRWPEGSNLKLLQWLCSDYFLKLSLLGQLPQAMVSRFVDYYIDYCGLLSVFFPLAVYLGYTSLWSCFFI